MNDEGDEEEETCGGASAAASEIVDGCVVLFDDVAFLSFPRGRLPAASL